ncbi:MAG: hypothetical protein AB7E60_11510, partial [Sphingobium sp.]
VEYVHQQLLSGTDARDILKGLTEHHKAKLTYPTYRTALRVGDIYTEAATSCDLATAKLLLNSFAKKASQHLDTCNNDQATIPDGGRI